jgi:hypothetical protein
MPMPGSQRMNSIDVAYFLYGYRWVFRIVFGLLIVAGSLRAFQIKHKWLPCIPLLLVLAISYFLNFEMTADKMFRQPEGLTFKPREGNLLKDSSIVVGVENNGQVKAYPIRFIAYHHQVQDSVGGKPLIITYCNVCRTGRVFEPTVKGRPEKFRLVGMDHFNAMFEDATTKSWWRQATGEAVAGPLRGEQLPEFESFQLTVEKLFALYPNAQVMQRDQSKTKFDSLGRYERGKSKGELTRTDSLSWKEKSWVVGIQMGSESKAYDWIRLKEQRIINDKIGDKPIVLALADDQQTFAVFERLSEAENFSIRNDTLFSGKITYDFSGKDLTASSRRLKRVKAYQEFWHSWRTFHPDTQQYQ